MNEIVSKFLLERILIGEDPGNLRADLPLMNSGILDSLSTLTLVTLLESTFDVKIEAFEIDTDNLGTIERIERFIERKRKSG